MIGNRTKLNSMFLVASLNRLTLVMNGYLVKQRNIARFARCKTNASNIDGDLGQLDSHKCTSIKQSNGINHFTRIQYVFQWHTMSP